MISYRGGLVIFALPISWREEYEPNGGGSFYEDRPESGTLRLNVLNFSSKDVPAQKMAETAFPEGSFELLEDGFPLRRTVVDGEEEGHKLHLHTWEIAVPVAPYSLRIVVFKHTVLAGQENDPAIAQELEFINSSIHAGSYSQEQGVAGSYIQR